MQREQWSEFSGVAGRLLSGSISGGSLISGIVVGLFLLAVGALLAFAGAGAMIMPFNLVVLGFVLARFAVNGLYGEWSGTIFSTAGGPWTVVSAVALRYLALTFLWYAPLALIGLEVARSSAGEPMAAMSMMTGGVLVLVAINLTAMALTPPLFLIASVSAASFGDLFSADHWRHVLGGRKDDLFTVYAVYSGALFMVVLLSLPVVMLAMAASYKLAMLAGALSFCLLFGVSVNLLGRLCGFFACGDLGSMDDQPDHGPDPMPETAPAAGPPVPPAIVPPAVVAPVASAPTAATTQAVPAPAPPAAGPRRPLDDAKARVDAATRDFAQNPDAALSALRELSAEFAPHPLVLHSLALHAYRAGSIEPSIEVAREAIPLCFERGHSYMAAELFREMRQHRSHLALTLEQYLTIGSTLVRMEDYATAAKAFTAVIGQDHGESRAVKGLLQVADKILHEKHKPQAAAKVYRYLIQHCSSSPLAEYMHNGLEEAERQAAQAPAAAG